MQRYFLTKDVDSNFNLDEETYKHFVTVLRSKIGSKAEFVLPNNEVVIAKLVTLDSKIATMEIEDKLVSNVELPVNVTIICGLPKGEKTEFIVQKATELGVHEIIFVQTAWSVAKWRDKADKKVQRLQKIAKSAAEQSHRTYVPKVKYFSNINEILTVKFDHKLVAYEEAAKIGEKSQLAKTIVDINKNQSIATFFGPEGGIKQDEIDILKENGYKVAAFGPRILRTETAPLYLLSTLSYALELNNN